jgi:hypothetical protein
MPNMYTPFKLFTNALFFSTGVGLESAGATIEISITTACWTKYTQSGNACQKAHRLCFCEMLITDGAGKDIAMEGTNRPNNKLTGSAAS